MGNGGQGGARTTRSNRYGSVPQPTSWQPHYVFAEPTAHSPELQAVLNQREQRLEHTAVEYLEAYRPDGTRIWQHSQNDPWLVVASQEAHQEAAGMVQLHNHPSTGQAPSEDDVATFMRYQGTKTTGEFRVVGDVRNEHIGKEASIKAGHTTPVVYSIRPPAEVPTFTRPDGTTIKLSMDEFYRMRVEPLYQQYEAEAQTWLRQHPDVLEQYVNPRHTIWQRVADETGLRYHVEHLPV